MLALLQKGVVERVPSHLQGRGFYSQYFIVPKPRVHPILDLKDLNKTVVKFKFRMVTLASVIPVLQLGDWYATLNLKDAYFHVAVRPSHRRLLPFIVSRRHFQFMVLPFGLSTAPRVFTKCKLVVAAFL